MSATRTFEPSFLDSSAGRLFTAYHPPRGVARGGVLICPPMFHEHVRGYRLFSLVADTLASVGLGVLRFDYPGSGDSDGEDTAFSLDLSENAARAALAFLEQRIGSLPKAMLGVRGGSYIAARLGAEHADARLWLWQPTGSGAQYLQTLAAIDRAERTSPLRFGDATRAVMLSDTNHLVGFPVSAECVEGLRTEPDPLDGRRHIDLVVDRAGQSSTPPGTLCVDLPETLARWPLQVDMQDVPVKPWRDVCAMLASNWESPSRG